MTPTVLAALTRECKGHRLRVPAHGKRAVKPPKLLGARPLDTLLFSKPFSVPGPPDHINLAVTCPQVLQT